LSIENWIQLIVPVVGVALAVISAGLSYFFAKRKQIHADECRLKEKYYIDLIQALSNLVIENSSENALNQLADVYNQLLLVGSSDVISAFITFKNYVNSPDREHSNDQEHDILLTELIMHMRRDLYKNKGVNNRYPRVSLIGKPCSSLVREKLL